MFTVTLIIRDADRKTEPWLPDGCSEPSSTQTFGNRLSFFWENLEFNEASRLQQKLVSIMHGNPSESWGIGIEYDL